MSHMDVLDAVARRFPGRPAVVDVGTGEARTYQDLDRRATSLAHGLRRLGVRRGDHVAWIAENRGECVEALFACARLGAALVPLNPRATAWERDRQLQLTSPAVVIAAATLAPTLTTDGGVPRVWLDATGPGGYESMLAAAPAATLASDATADAIAAVLFTSGSTATPRGARLPQRMLAINALASATTWGFTEETRVAIATPLWHAGGFGAMLLPALTAGGTIIVLPSFSPTDFWPTLARHRVTTLFGVPTLWQRALDAPGADGARRHGLEWLLCGGAPMPRRLHERYRALGLPLRQGLGMTEAGINLCTPTPQDAEEAPLSVGRPLPEIAIEIAEWAPATSSLTDADAALAPQRRTRSDGELVVGGPCVAAGYVGPPDADDQTFTPDGRVRTGDLVRRDDAGRLRVEGRLKQVYTTSGFSVSPAEVELALHECADLEAAAVVAVPDASRGEVGHAFVELAAGRQADEASLRRALRTRVSGYKVPVRIHIVDDLPRTSSGKVDRQALRATLGP